MSSGPRSFLPELFSRSRRLPAVFRFPAFRLLISGVCLLVPVFFFPSSAHADCTSPAKPAGSLEYFTASSQYKICDGTNWNVVSLSATANGTCSTAHGINYDTTLKSHEVCNGTNYYPVNCILGGAGSNYCNTSVLSEIDDPNASADDNFGGAVAFSGDGTTAIVGRPSRCCLQTQGKAYVYAQSAGSWVLQATFTAADGSATDSYGEAVALSSDGSTALVGAYGHSSNTGAAYVYTRSYAAWTLQQELTASDAAAGDWFGRSVALSADGATALIGAPAKSTNTGAAYVFTRSGSTWTQQQKLTASDAATNNYFGISVALSGSADSGNTALIGAYEKAAAGAANLVFVTSGSWNGALGGAGGISVSTTLCSNSVTTAGLPSGSYLALLAITTGVDDPATRFTHSTIPYKLVDGTVIANNWTDLTDGTLAHSINEDEYGNAWAGVSGTFIWSNVAADGTATVSGSSSSGNCKGWTVTSNATGEIDFPSGGSLTCGGSASLYCFEQDGSVVANAGAAYVFTRSGSTWTQQQELTPTNTLAGDFFGAAVALSSDGNTALIGAYGKSNLRGGADVFTRSGGVWTQQAELTPSDGVHYGEFGVAVSLSSDGNTALIGAGAPDSALTEAYAFMRSGTTWGQTTAMTLTPSTYAGFGIAVALSGDGTTALIGAPNQNISNGVSQAGAVYFLNTFAPQQQVIPADGSTTGQFGQYVAISGDGNTAITGGQGGSFGAFYIYVKSGTTWSLQQEFNFSCLNVSGVALSYDGNTAAIFDSFPGCSTTYVYTRSGTTWSQQTSITSAVGSVALSSDGNTLLIGASGETEGANTFQGATYVYTRSGSTWTQQQKLTASNGAAQDQFGYSVALSGSSDSSNTALIGAAGVSSGAGAAYVFTRSGSVWTQQQEITASDGAASDSFGYNVSLSSDGNTALVGAPAWGGSATHPNGLAYVFKRSGSTWAQQQEITASDGASGDTFGKSVSLDSTGTTALIGTTYKNNNHGEAYAFTLSGGIWMQQAELLAYNQTGAISGASTGFFGSSVGLTTAGNAAVIGSGGVCCGNNIYNKGSMYFVNWDALQSCVANGNVNQGAASTKTNVASWTALTTVSLNAGDTLLVCTASTSGDTISSVTWNGTAMTADAFTNAPYVSIYSLPITTGGTGNIVVNFSAHSTSGKALSALAVSGLATSTPLDKTSWLVGTSTTPSSNATATTSQAYEFVYGCMAINGPSTDTVGTWNSPFIGNNRVGTTGSSAGTNVIAQDGYQSVSATGAYNAQLTGITSRAWAGAIATYKSTNISATCQSYGACSNAASSLKYDSSLGTFTWCDGTNWRAVKAP